MKKKYLTRKEIEIIDVDAPMSKQEAADLYQKMTNGMVKYKDQLELVKDIPLVATIGLNVIGFGNAIVGGFRELFDVAPTAPNATLSAATFTAGAACLLFTTIAFKKCDEKFDKLRRVALPKIDKLQKMAETEEVEDEIE